MGSDAHLGLNPTALILRTRVEETNMPEPMRTTKYVTLAQAADILGQSVKTVRRRISDGTLPAYRVGPRSIRLRIEDLEVSCRRIPSARP